VDECKSQQPGDVVIANTAAGAAYGTKEFLATGVGFGREAGASTRPLVSST